MILGGFGYHRKGSLSLHFHIKMASYMIHSLSPRWIYGVGWRGRRRWWSQWGKMIGLSSFVRKGWRGINGDSGKLKFGFLLVWCECSRKGFVFSKDVNFKTKTKNKWVFENSSLMGGIRLDQAQIKISRIVSDLFNLV